MREARISPWASKDLVEIHKGLAREAGEGRAANVIDAILARANTLAVFPNLGLRCEELHEGWRFALQGSYRLYYREIDTGVELSRVIHHRRDQRRALRSKL